MCPTSTASKYASNLVRSLLLSVSPNLDDYGLQVRTDIASEYISKLARSRSCSESLSSLNHGLLVSHQIPSITAFQFISKLAQLWPPSSHTHGHQVTLQSRLITISECLPMFTRTRPTSISPHILNCRFQLHLWSCSIPASVCLSQFTRSSFSGANQGARKFRLQPVQTYCVWMSS